MSDELSSDVLEAQFGPTTVEILWQNGLTRLIRTKTADDARVLEISYVNFDPAGIGRFPKIHAAIQAGESMGKAFRAAGVPFYRINRAVLKHSVPGNLSRQFASQAKATVIDVEIRVGSDRTPYATVLEIYNPLIQWPQPIGRKLRPDDTIIRKIDELLERSA